MMSAAAKDSTRTKNEMCSMDLETRRLLVSLLRAVSTKWAGFGVYRSKMWINHRSLMQGLLKIQNSHCD